LRSCFGSILSSRTFTRRNRVRTRRRTRRHRRHSRNQRSCCSAMRSWIDFTHQARHEQAGRRPALVLSRATYNRRSRLMRCCPVTNQGKGYPFEVSVTPIRWQGHGGCSGEPSAM